MGEGTLLEIALRPHAPMPYVQAAAPLAALALCEALGGGAQVLWPSTVLLDGAEYARVTAAAGYDEGIFVRLRIAFAQPCNSLDMLEQAVLSRADAWEQAVCAGGSAAGPIAAFAGEYFDRLAGMGGTVELLFPNGRVFCRAELRGIDMWGRISVQAEDGRSMDLSPEQVSLRLVP